MHTGNYIKLKITLLIKQVISQIKQACCQEKQGNFINIRE